MSSSVNIDRKNVLTHGEGPTQGLDDTALTAEAQYLINFSRLNRKFCLSMHYNGSNSLLFVNATVQSKRFWNEKKNYPFRKYFRRCLSQQHEKN